MFRSIASQLALIIGLLFVLFAFVLLQLYLYSSQQLSDEVGQALHRDLAHHIVQDDTNLQAGIIDTNTLMNAFHTQMLLGPEWEFYALDNTGKILAYSAPKGVVKLKQVNLHPIKAYLQGAIFPLYGDDPRTPNTEKIFSVSSINSPSGQIIGYLYVIIGGQKHDTTMAQISESKVLKESAFILGAAILFGLTAMFIAITIITKPLKKLSQYSLEYVNNDFTEMQQRKESLFSNKEIEDLQHSFISSAQHIKQQLSQIKNTEQLRRELLSHISHDFRTPLTALNGYLETWLITPAPQRSNELIHYALKNGQQINQLVDQLFELARLESGDVQFIPEHVNVVELAYDVMQRLRYQADKQQVALTVQADHENGIIAYADISKLERVLVNLIDNAIRHTQASGEVSVQIRDLNDKVEMQIVDNGKGIANDELQAIFNPKYQASNSQGNATNLGLGLSIVKHLLAMHRSAISVSSQPGIGSQFTFVLAKNGHD
ncbi:HAMP domain-containing sensor histidine kinase [Psychromonas sp. MME2]|uniref:HAMP domain-containing sensor histidine kinase n=1 Tax=unclassified Psychromonas TaxID=2614957 RepID=UPI00339BFF2E